MASGIMHLAIIKKISETYRCKEPKRLNFGAVLPDYSEDRRKAHLRILVWGRNKRTYDLNGFRARFGAKIREDDLYLGYYLHLVQDVIYRHFVYDRYHWNPNIPGHTEKLHNDYSLLNLYVREKYGLENDLRIPEGAEDGIVCGSEAVDGRIHDRHGHILLGKMRVIVHAGKGVLHETVKRLLIHSFLQLLTAGHAGRRPCPAIFSAALFSGAAVSAFLRIPA